MIEQLEYGYNLRQRAERAELRAFLLNIALAGAEAEGERRGALIEELAESVHTARVQTLGVCDQVRTSEARVAALEAEMAELPEDRSVHEVCQRMRELAAHVATIWLAGAYGLPGDPDLAMMSEALAPVSVIWVQGGGVT